MNTKVILHNGNIHDRSNIVMAYEGRIEQPVPDEDVLIEPDTGVVIARLHPGVALAGKPYWEVEVGQFKGQSRYYLTVEPVIEEHVILTALVVETHLGREQAMNWLGAAINEAPLRTPEAGVTHVNSWWFAEDDRTDGSDCESAVFIPYDFQQRISQPSARRILEAVCEVVNEADRSEGQFTVDQVCQVIGNPDIYPEPETVRWFINEDGGVYSMEPTRQRVEFPNDDHFPYLTEKDAQTVADIQAEAIEFTRGDA